MSEEEEIKPEELRQLAMSLRVQALAVLGTDPDHAGRLYEEARQYEEWASAHEAAQRYDAEEESMDVL